MNRAVSDGFPTISPNNVYPLCMLNAKRAHFYRSRIERYTPASFRLKVQFHGMKVLMYLLFVVGLISLQHYIYVLYAIAI